MYIKLLPQSEAIRQEAEGSVVVSDLERFQKMKDGEFRELRVGGLWWASDEIKTDKMLETQSVFGVVVGLDLVKVQILIPVVPLLRSPSASHTPSLPPLFHERRISRRLGRHEKKKERDHSTSSTLRLWFKAALSLFLSLYPSAAPPPLVLCLQGVYSMS